MEDRFNQKIFEDQSIVNENCFQFVPAIFSLTGQIHEEINRFIKEQIQQQLINSEGEAKKSRANFMVWWSKCISAGIFRTASKNTVFSAQRISKSINDAQGPMLQANSDSEGDE